MPDQEPATETSPPPPSQGDTTLVEPAYEIPLTPDELKMLGELVVIFGQIEQIMLLMVKRSSGSLSKATKILLKSPGTGKSAEIRKEEMAVIFSGYDDKDILPVIEDVCNEIKLVNDQRNDLVHAFYAERSEIQIYGYSGYFEDISWGPKYDTPGVFYSLHPSAQPVAIRTRTDNRTLVENIRDVRNKSASVSVRIRDIYDWKYNPAAGAPRPSLLTNSSS